MRQVGLISGVPLIVGTMIGSGIFISPKGVLRQTGSVSVSLLVWFGCGVLSLMGSYCYAELGTTISKSGAEYVYLLESFGQIPAFLYSWTSLMVIKTSGPAVIALAFANYVLHPVFDECGPPVVLRKLLGATAVITVCLVNSFSVRLAARVQVLFTVIKLSVLVVIIIGGMVRLSQGGTKYLASDFEDSTDNPSNIALAFYSGLWAYDSWNNLNFVTEEIKNSKRNLPLSIFIAIPLVTVVYVLTNISYFSVMSKEELLASPAVASLWGERVLGGAAILIPIAVACSTFGAINGSAFTGGRQTYVAAREGHLPEVISFVNVKHNTPLPSLVVNAPIIIPILFLLCSIHLVIGPIVNQPKMEFLYAALFILGGLILYFPFVHFKLRVPGIDNLTVWMQLFAEISPATIAPEDS